MHISPHSADFPLFRRTCLRGVRSHQRDKTFLHLIVRIIKKKRAKLTVIVLYGQVTALINHRQRLLRLTN